MSDSAGPMDPPRLDAATTLAADRTRLAVERTMLAWIRTATALITFGFGVGKFSDILRPGAEKSNYQLGAPQLGFVMVCVGITSLVFAFIEHRRNIRDLAIHYGKRPRSSAVILAGIVALLGVFALVTMILRP
jgi:putative membrane protein